MKAIAYVVLDQSVYPFVFIRVGVIVICNVINYNFPVIAIAVKTFRFPVIVIEEKSCLNCELLLPLRNKYLLDKKSSLKVNRIDLQTQVE